MGAMMNKQAKRKNGVIVSRGIEWTEATWNPIGGCKHRCRWRMPDGTIAICYAEEVANNVARRAYSDGFEAHYWHPQRLDEPLKHTEPMRIFLDSMSDLMGAWVPEDQIQQVLDVCAQADWHTFQLLTKNAPRLKKFIFPPNVHVGVSSSPDFMLGKELSGQQKIRYMHKALGVLNSLDVPVRWISFEPLSWDVSEIVAEYPRAIQWAVIGAATNGKKKYQPNPLHVDNLLNVLNERDIPVFFKGNLNWKPWREDFPGQDEKDKPLHVQLEERGEQPLFDLSKYV